LFPNFGLVALAWFASLGIDFYSVFNNVHGDIGHYQEWGGDALKGQLPYSGFEFQYPPYCLPWFMLAASFPDEHTGVRVFTLEMSAVDALIKALLLVAGFRWLKSWRAWVPFAVFTTAGVLQYFIFLKRFDLIPAAMTLAATLLLAAGSPLASGLFVALGAGTKLYPVLMIPTFGLVAWRAGNVRRFVIGLAAGSAPLFLLAFFMPWWNFLSLHEARGLQVESLYAGVIWLGQYAGLEGVTWHIQRASFEVHGPWTDAGLTLSKVLLTLTVLMSVAVSGEAASRGRGRQPGELARLALLPVLAFVAFNFVLSPQFMIWIIVLTALALTDRWSWPLAAILVGEALTPLIYPSKTYRTGLDLPRTVSMNIRNFALAAAWVGLLIETRRSARAVGLSQRRT
jgi:hypothetical protein